MVIEEIINEIDINSQSTKPVISRLAIISAMFGILGPFFTGAMWIVTCNNFSTLGSLLVIAPFSCGLTWILGIVLGIKVLKQIESSQGQLVGREYAIVGIFTSALWMLLIFMVLFLPMIYCVNS